MDRAVATTLVISRLILTACAVVLTAAVALHLRYDVHHQPGSTWVFDNWTRDVQACAPNTESHVPGAAPDPFADLIPKAPTDCWVINLR
jgi:hypothetical protein